MLGKITNYQTPSDWDIYKAFCMQRKCLLPVYEIIIIFHALFERYSIAKHETYLGRLTLHNQFINGHRHHSLDADKLQIKWSVADSIQRLAGHQSGCFVGPESNQWS
ncbi:hypothetical protein C0J52_17611 [Blattella germanica]|nr:hypothetical protein C0J52_17611 [Blattella germanica]